MSLRERGLIRKYPLAAAIIIVVSVAIYSNTLNGGFVWDDRGTIVSNASLREIKNIPLFL